MPIICQHKHINEAAFSTSHNVLANKLSCVYANRRTEGQMEFKGGVRDGEREGERGDEAFRSK